MRLASLLNTAGGGPAAPGAPQREAFGKAVRDRPKNPAWEKIWGEALGRAARKQGLLRCCDDVTTTPSAPALRRALRRGRSWRSRTSATGCVCAARRRALRLSSAKPRAEAVWRGGWARRACSLGQEERKACAVDRLQHLGAAPRV